MLPCSLNVGLYTHILIVIKQKLDRRELSVTSSGHQCLDFCFSSQQLVWEKQAGENDLWWKIVLYESWKWVPIV